MSIPGLTIDSPTVQPLIEVGDFHRLATRLTPTNGAELITFIVEARDCPGFA